MTDEARLTISAIVCAYNEASYLPACLHALLAQTRQPDEIIIIDNASTDGTGDLARSIPGVRVIHEPSRGLVVARSGRSRRKSELRTPNSEIRNWKLEIGNQ